MKNIAMIRLKSAWKLNIKIHVCLYVIDENFTKFLRWVVSFVITWFTDIYNFYLC